MKRLCRLQLDDVKVRVFDRSTFAPRLSGHGLHGHCKILQTVWWMPPSAWLEEPSAGRLQTWPRHSAPTAQRVWLISPSLATAWRNVEEMKTICQGLRVNTSCSMILWMSAGLTDQHVELLTQALKHNTGLQRLNLDDNPYYGDEAAEALAQAAVAVGTDRTKRCMVDVDTTNMTRRGMHALDALNRVEGMITVRFSRMFDTLKMLTGLGCVADTVSC